MGNKKCFYKYRRLFYEKDPENLDPYVIDILQKGQLYFACPKDFNDPFDGVVEYDETVTPEDIRPLGKRLGIDEDKIEEIINIHKNNPEAFRNRLNKSYNDLQNDNKLRILCLSDTELSPLLWAHYAAQHTGVCIGFRTYKLDEKTYGIKLKPEFIKPDCLVYPDIMIPFPVEYTDNVPQKYHFGKKNVEALKESFLNKSKEWQYEKEVRVVTLESQLVCNPVEIDVNEIEEIIFGIRTSSDLIEKVKKIVSKEPYVSPGPKLYQCQRIPGTYCLEKKLLS